MKLGIKGRCHFVPEFYFNSVLSAQNDLQIFSSIRTVNEKESVKLICSTLAIIQKLPGNIKEDLINGSDPH